MPDKDVRYLHLYPAQEYVTGGEPLNVMFAVKNSAPSALEPELRLWLCADETWRLAAAEKTPLKPKTVTHVYMQVPAAAFLPAFWDGIQPEEFLLLCAAAPPDGAPDKRCTALLTLRD